MALFFDLIFKVPKLSKIVWEQASKVGLEYLINQEFSLTGCYAYGFLLKKFTTYYL